MKKVLEEEILYQDPNNKEFIKTQIFEDGSSRILVALNNNQKAASLTMRLVGFLKSEGKLWKSA